MRNLKLSWRILTNLKHDPVHVEAALVYIYSITTKGFEIIIKRETSKPITKSDYWPKLNKQPPSLYFRFIRKEDFSVETRADILVVKPISIMNKPDDFKHFTDNGTVIQSYGKLLVSKKIAKTEFNT